MQYATKPDAQGFDEVRITTIPRYKTSGLSGDEWRISGLCQIFRKGKVIHEFRMGNVENCAKALPYHIMTAHDEGKFYFAGGEDGKCDQEGCAEEATVLYRVKKSFCNKPYAHEAEELEKYPQYRGFCERHSKRGDCAFDDADSNYELIEGVQKETQSQDESPSVFGGAIVI